MFKKVVLAHFDPVNLRQSVTAKALGLTQGAVSQWGEIIPELTARRIEEFTGGELKFDPELYRRERSA